MNIYKYRVIIATIVAGAGIILGAIYLELKILNNNPAEQTISPTKSNSTRGPTETIGHRVSFTRSIEISDVDYDNRDDQGDIPSHISSEGNEEQVINIGENLDANDRSPRYGEEEVVNR